MKRLDGSQVAIVFNSLVVVVVVVFDVFVVVVVVVVVVKFRQN